MDTDVAILIVDDRRENLIAVESILDSGDYELVSASSGSEALRQILDRDFAVILIDVVMPAMDGFELATIIKKRDRSRHTPIIFLTAWAPNLSQIYRGYSVGAVDYMTKPLDADVLRAKVAIFVELFRKDRRIQEQAEALRAAERRERELELASIRTSNEQRYRNLAEAISHIVWTADPAGTIGYINQRWHEYTGSPLDASAWGWLEAVHPDDAPRCANAWREGIASRNVFELQCRLKRRDGEYRWHVCRAVPELEGVRIVAWLGTYTDLDDLHRAYEASEQTVRMREEFLSIASHELRTPLTTLQLRLQSLCDQLPENVDAKSGSKLQSALRQTHRLISLVDKLLDVSRIVNGQITLQREPFDLAAVVSELVERFTEAAANEGVQLAFRAEGPAMGAWDRLRIEQIVENLLGNAIKYAPDGPVDVTVRTRDEIALLTVRDRGNGIASEDHQRIFGPFERAVSSRNYGGLGLGLYIAHENAVAHGGKLSVVSEPGSGATFTAELPMKPPSG